MWSHPTFLKRCEEWRQKNTEPPLKEGTRIARGFADLGYEEFVLLPGKKLLSLYSGTLTQFPEEHAHFFFPVPSADEMVEDIERKGFDIVSLEYRDQRTWVATMEDCKSHKRSVFEGGTLEIVLITALMA